MIVAKIHRLENEIVDFKSFFETSYGGNLAQLEREVSRVKAELSAVTWKADSLEVHTRIVPF